MDIFSLVSHFSFLSPSVWETARYRLKYCLKGPLSPKTTNQSSKISMIQVTMDNTNISTKYFILSMVCTDEGGTTACPPVNDQFAKARGLSPRIGGLMIPETDNKNVIKIHKK